MRKKSLDQTIWADLKSVDGSSVLLSVPHKVPLGRPKKHLAKPGGVHGWQRTYTVNHGYHLTESIFKILSNFMNNHWRAEWEGWVRYPLAARTYWTWSSEVKWADGPAGSQIPWQKTIRNAAELVFLERTRLSRNVTQGLSKCFETATL